MASYLNPALFLNGADYYQDKYLGWVLIGDYKDTNAELEADTKVTSTLTSSNYLPENEACVAGLSLPVLASTAMTVSSNDPNAISQSLTSDSVTGYNYNESETVSKADSSTSIVFSSSISESTMILPTGITASTKDAIGIDLSTNGYLLLVAYNLVSSTTEGVDGNDLLVSIDSSTKKVNETSWNSLVDTRFADVIYKTGGVYDSTAALTSAGLLNHKYCTPLFAYSVSNQTLCNDYTFTGFSVGNVTVTLSGLTSN